MTAATATRPTTRSNPLVRVPAGQECDLAPLAFIYKRISNDPEGLELGVSRQDEDLRAQVAADECELAGVYCDNDRGASTRSRKPRPDFDALLLDAVKAATLNPGRQVRIYAYTSARLTRRPREKEDLIDLAERYGVQFRYLRSPSFDLNTADGRFIARILANKDTQESEQISERVIRAFDQRAASGVYLGGGRPFGYRVEATVVLDDQGRATDHVTKRLVIEPREAAAIRIAVRRMLASKFAYTMSDVVRFWNRVVPTPRGAEKWTYQAVRSVLTRGRIAGISERNGEKVAVGNWPAIITEDQLAAVRAKYGKPKDGRGVNRGAGRGRSVKWVGSGLYRCGRDGCVSALRPNNSTDGPRYRCAAFGHLTVPAVELDAYVRGVVAELLAEYGASLLAGVKADEAVQLASDAEALRVRLEELSEEFIANRVSLRTYTTAATKLEETLFALEEQRSALETSGTELRGVADAPDPVAAFAELTPDRQRTVVGVLIDVAVRPGVKGKPRTGEVRNIADRVEISRKISDRGATPPLGVAA